MKKSCVPYGSDVSGGEFECADCSKRIKMASRSSLPPCPNFDSSVHNEKCWIVIKGQGDSPNDPYPSK